MGQTDWHMPHFMQAVILSSSAMRRWANSCRLFMN